MCSLAVSWISNAHADCCEHLWNQHPLLSSTPCLSILLPLLLSSSLQVFFPHSKNFSCCFEAHGVKPRSPVWPWTWYCPQEPDQLLSGRTAADTDAPESTGSLWFRRKQVGDFWFRNCRQPLSPGEGAVPCLCCQSRRTDQLFQFSLYAWDGDSD